MIAETGSWFLAEQLPLHNYTSLLQTMKGYGTIVNNSGTKKQGLFLLPERQGDFNTTPAEHDGAQQAEQMSWCVLK